MKKENPRMCILSRKRFPKEELIRFERKDGKYLYPSSSGRGVYVSKKVLLSINGKALLEKRFHLSWDEEDWERIKRDAQK